MRRLCSLEQPSHFLEECGMKIVNVLGSDLVCSLGFNLDGLTNLKMVKVIRPIIRNITYQIHIHIHNHNHIHIHVFVFTFI